MSGCSQGSKNNYLDKLEDIKVNYNEDAFELLDDEQSLLLLNDDVNTFDYVIEVLMKVCNHTLEQAETCAMITHYKGKCSVKSGTYEELEPYYISLLNHHLYAKIQ